MLRIIELCRRTSSASVTYYADHRLITRAEYNRLSDKSTITDCFSDHTNGSVRREYKTVRIEEV